jgi:endonuclease/exonuclease/phosphatase (EEP) superfamily protein YafD
LYSRAPLGDARIARYGAGSTPSAVARVALGGRTLTFVLVHPPAPYSRGNASGHRNEFRALASEPFGRPLAVCGDLNAPPWSWAYDHLVSEADLVDANGDRLDGTWPALLPGFLRLPIDTCLLSDGVTVTERDVGPAVGSDHLPVVLELAPS